MFETVIACRLSPTQFVGATCPIGTVHVTAPRDLRFWYPQQRTTRLHRTHELAGIVTLTTSHRWGDFAQEYVTLIARACDGIVAIDGEVNEDLDPAAISDRELAIEWRILDARSRTAIEEHDRTLRRIRAEAPRLHAS